MIIDAHTHGTHGKYLDQILDAGGDWAKKRISRVRGISAQRPAWSDVALRVQQLDRNAIDLQVVTPGVGMNANNFPGDIPALLAVTKAVNDNMARMMEDSKGRLLTIGNVPLAAFHQGGEQEMERAIKGLGLKGVDLPCDIKGKPLDLPEFEPFWAKAAELDIPVYIHPRSPEKHSNPSYEPDRVLTHTFGLPYNTTITLGRLVLSGIMERYPNLKIVSHHLGGLLSFYWGRLGETYHSESTKPERVVPRPLLDYFSRFYYDTAVGGSAAAIRCTYDVFGADQIVFATDAPWGPGAGEGRLADYPNVVKSVGLSDAENKKIFEDNARKILNLP